MRDMSFEIISNSEADARCEHSYTEAPLYECINPQGEFVVGYGNMPVSRVVGVRRSCVKCGRIVEEFGGRKK